MSPFSRFTWFTCVLLLGIASLGRSQSSTLVPACRGLNGSSEGCLWWQQSPAAPSDKMVIYFSGGEQGCQLYSPASPSVYDTLARSYVAKGFVFVCANIYETFFTPSAANHPYADEAERIDTVVKAITSSLPIKKTWTGKKLLISGISHGSTAVPNAMAREGYAAQKAWRGTKLTAACFLDGQYDVFYNQTFWRNAKSLACELFMQRTICGRYLGRNCLPPQFNQAMSRDSIVLTDLHIPNGPQANDIKNWKLVSCGSEHSACGSDPDMLPEAPQKEYCRQISARSGHFCTFVSLPKQSHQECGLQGVADEQCAGWFDKLPEETY